MSKTYLFETIQILHGSGEKVVKDAVLIVNGKIKAFGDAAKAVGKDLNIPSKTSPEKILAPCLVDPHSVLEEPFNSQVETIWSLANKAIDGGYGQIALLPRSKSWRDLPEKLQGFASNKNSLKFHLWGGFSKEGKGIELAPHGDLVSHGAIGIAEDTEIPPLDLLHKGLLLGEMGSKPILLAPRSQKVQANGIVRESVEALRAGWPQDPISSEIIPLTQLLEISKHFESSEIRLMNISTAKGAELLRGCSEKPMCSVGWWHLIKDSSSLSMTDLGWRVLPSLGNSLDRKKLIECLFDRTISAVAVNSVGISDEQSKLPPDQRPAGLTGHQLVLATLWEELVIRENWNIELLWEVLSFAPSRMLGLQEERLQEGSNRWLLFDPNEEWINTKHAERLPFSANLPRQEEKILGKVIDCGLNNLVSQFD